MDDDRHQPGAVGAGSAWAIGAGLRRIDVSFEKPPRGIGTKTARSSSEPIATNQQFEAAMSKISILFVLLMSGALYDPPRVLHQLGPEAAAIGWQISTTLRLR
jgi:hypothetical protein